MVSASNRLDRWRASVPGSLGKLLICPAVPVQELGDPVDPGGLGLLEQALERSPVHQRAAGGSAWCPRGWSSPRGAGAEPSPSGRRASDGPRSASRKPGRGSSAAVTGGRPVQDGDSALTSSGRTPEERTTPAVAGRSPLHADAGPGSIVQAQHALAWANPASADELPHVKLRCCSVVGRFGGRCQVPLPGPPIAGFLRRDAGSCLELQPPPVPRQV